MNDRMWTISCHREQDLERLTGYDRTRGQDVTSCPNDRNFTDRSVAYTPACNGVVTGCGGATFSLCSHDRR